jgi:periplasmic protein TonB
MNRRSIASPNAHFLIGEMPAPQLGGRRWGGTGLSIAAHAIGFGILIYAATHVPQVADTAGSIPDRLRVVLSDRLGPSGVGGRGGPAAVPARRAETPAPVLDLTPKAQPADAPPPDLIVPVITAQSQQVLPGALIQMPTASPGRGAGPGRGPGSGPGEGYGVGPGLGGVGGDGFGAGNDVTAPRLIAEVKPGYTVNAMRAKIQGSVEMDAVVRPDGSVEPGSVRITRSLDSTYGLDEQAIRAVRQWRFRPGTLKGQPVAVRVSVELTFTLR